MPDTESMTGGQGLHHQINSSITSTSVVSYSELLFSGDLDVDDHHHLLDSASANSCFSFTSPLEDPPKMLCFGGDDSVDDIYGLQGDFPENEIKFVPKTEPTSCSNYSSASVPSTTIKANNPSKPKKKRNVGGAGETELGVAAAGHEVNKKSGVGNVASAAAAASTEGTKKNNKKAKSANNSSETRHAKVKKARLGERIVALQQLVSPFGKTDTASVLHETKGYITFLQQQVQLLCSPYLHLQSIHHHEGKGKGVKEEEQVESRKDLRSKGLCLMPTGITSLHLTDNNGADYWSPTNLDRSTSIVTPN